MASSGAGTSLGSEYDVFLSFRASDTRVRFTDSLFHSLTDAGIRVFRDDEELRVGERIDGLLQRAIDNSRIYILVLSRTYASSPWCLRELTRIVANTLESEGTKEILPIFFDVNPDDVKLKTPLYRDTIINLERNKKLSSELVDTWREALVKVTAIKGWEANKYEGLGELILSIVREVVNKLKEEQKWVNERLVGLNDQVKGVIKLLDFKSGGVRLLMIYGMGGIGKTTLTRVVLDELSYHFGKYCYFLEDVRANSSRANGLVELQKKLLSQIGHPAKIWRIEEIDYGMEMIGEALCDKKVLIILDDVDNSEQVEKLVGKISLHSGSRILISTRNKDVLRTYKPQYQIFKYEMEGMSYDNALQLFSWHAFHGDHPPDDYTDLSRDIITTTGRLPLALEVIGSFLYRKNSQELWKGILDKLNKVSPMDVYGKLKIIYEGLTFSQQQIFLHIACFFVGHDTTNALYMWTDCDFFQDREVSPVITLPVLIRLSLVKILGNNTFWMHDQLRDFGREIVRLENLKNPEQRSRIWTSMEDLDATRIKQNTDVTHCSFSFADGPGS
ncbi:disease resistance protein L6-like [Rhodamnia argentea]|uniref:Disease resistance protein L6-like n=1 Tax=Rhodamnia argentea TaxID=178133 RepID=A0ABM3HW04_9MYRT|nr:disease resistance protein L6-like [Rhodamnia argentea]